MPTSEIAKRYFAALAHHDLDGAAACWAPDGVDRLVGQTELVGPAGVRAYFAALFDAFPDFTLEIVELTTYRNRTAVRWRATGTFGGPGTFQGFEPNGARIELEGCDVVSVADDLITHNDAYIDSGLIARQLGFLPPAGSLQEARLTRLANLRTRIAGRLQAAQPERIAEGVWVVRGGFPMRTMNVYLLEDDGGVTLFDAGIASMAGSVAAAAARLGGLKRVVLGHADADHRGVAPALGAPVFCHPAERDAAQSPDSLRQYYDLTKLNPLGRFVYSRLLPMWDGGAVSIEGTVEEGDEVAGFEVVNLPGHAPGLIGLFRDSDRLALVSDCFYTIDPRTGIKGAARVPHPAFDADVEQARASLRKLAELDPAVAWAGHADPVRGDVRAELERAAAAPVP
ncbi:MAG TPA: nuclear transport factor 2 family protein [Solirubrobacteraceae bacterium]|jgi:glyoxylase-like metal-dependent hydrolase (beta-lactamase superfamily II)/predicted ester cyclase|nr:nuclear transport factor 2 family protein [Solirubrobacteraceae bacterium]